MLVLSLRHSKRPLSVGAIEVLRPQTTTWSSLIRSQPKAFLQMIVCWASFFAQGPVHCLADAAWIFGSSETFP